jgi:MSHA biogenesis protein MshP
MTQRRQAGFALMMAVFLIVTLAAIGVYLLTVTTAQTEAVAQDEQAARAHQAARAGMEWAAYRVLRTGLGCAPLTQTLALGQGLSGFSSTIQIECDGAEVEGGASIELFRVTATGCNSGTCPAGAPGPTYVERQLHLTLAR